MVQYFSAVEVREEHFKRMPKELAEIFSVLNDDVALLNRVWLMFLALFANSVERVQLLNYCAEAFFNTLQSVLWDDAMLRISRLIDKAGPASRRNASIPALLEVAGRSLPREANERLYNSWDLLTKLGSTLRTERNKRLAHTDLLTRLSHWNESPSGPSRLVLQSAVDAINEAMNEVSRFFLGSEIRYDLIIQKGDVEHLLFYLTEGLKSSKKRAERDK